MDGKNINRKIVIFLFSELLLVGLDSIPLFLRRKEGGSSLVMVVSVFFMWFPAIATFITRGLTGDKSRLPVKPLIKKNWKMYVIAAYAPGIAIVFGVFVYFALFKGQLDLSLSVLNDLIVTHGQQIRLPILSVPSLILIVTGLVLFAPVVIVNHILAFGEEIGWRGYLLPLLCGKFGIFRGIITDGVLWGIAHATLVAFGVNYAGDYPGAPYTGILMMIVFAVFVGIFLSYLTIQTESIFPACISHGVINALREAPLFICKPDYNALLGPKPSGIVGMCGFIILGIVLMLYIKNRGHKLYNAQDSRVGDYDFTTPSDIQ